ncbi:helix-turn-helix transcriptional regulator [Caldicellulosiruptor morganii]|uniref:WYL domain-containing protein n=1 Tax=Caldicellulosiruptor morganii TaxID=1387555 RepID=A0ABY7BMX6_9FIRM|nr:WYL domain-containing protein [Caldicellulosiruptor morganii]WAM33875.1 WYL domain-containing protein [Caldicellulosiruptor morganii]
MAEFNPFINHFNKLRNFSRLVYLYGCYSREDAKLFQIGKRTFDEELRRMRVFLKEDEYLSVEKEGKKALPCVVEDFFREVENPLINIYFSKTSTSLQTTLFFMILQILNSSKDKKATTNEIMDKIYFALDERTKDRAVDSSIKRTLKQMQSMGIIRFLKKEKVYVLSNTIERLFKGFSRDELKNIYLSVLFFINTNVPNVPGWFLKESLEKYLLKNGEEEFIKEANQLFWFTYIPHHYVLDEEIVWRFWYAASLGNKVKIWYYPRSGSQKKEYSCIPLRIIYDVKLGRWYFIILDEKEINTLPASRVEKIEILDEKFDRSLFEKFWPVIEKCFFVSVPLKEEGFKKIRFRFVLDKDTNYNFVLNRVKRELKGAHIEMISQNEFVVDYELSNLKEIKPWLRSFSHRVVVEDDSPDSQKLRQEMMDEWREILKNYGDIQ